VIDGHLSRVCGAEPYARPMAVVDEVWLSVLAGKNPDSGDAYTRYPYPLKGLLDTGATHSSIPLDIAKSVRREPHGRTPVRDYDCQQRLHPYYYVKLSVPGIKPRLRLKAVGAKRSSVILGQDFLQGLAFLMDTTRGKWRVGRPRWPTTISTRIAFRLFGLE